MQGWDREVGLGGWWCKMWVGVVVNVYTIGDYENIFSLVPV